MRSHLLIALLLLPGCAYLKDRANDVLDVFWSDVGIGPGLYVSARATDFLAVGFGYKEQAIAGLHGRFAGTGSSLAVGLGPAVIGNDRFDCSPVLPQDPSVFDAEQEPPASQLLVVPCSFEHAGFEPCDYSEGHRDLHFLDVNAGAALLLVGARVGFSPGELLDCVLGLFGIDLAADDGFGRWDPDRVSPVWMQTNQQGN
jgi:hypothetical protein